MKARVFLSVGLIAILVTTWSGMSPAAVAQGAAQTESPTPILVLTPAPKPSKPPSIIPYCLAVNPAPILGDPLAACNAKERVIFMIGLAADQGTRGRLVATLTDQLQNYYLADDARLVAEPTWTTDDFVTQCEADRQLPNAPKEGALVIAVVALASGLHDAFTTYRSKVEAGVNVLYADCALKKKSPPKADFAKFVPSKNHGTLKPSASPSAAPAPPPVYAYIWSSHTQFGQEWKTSTNTARYFSFVTALLSFVAIYEAFAPSKSFTVSSTTSFPSPTPPLPSSWPSSMTSSSTSSTNSGFGTQSQALLTSAATNSTVLPVIPADDAQAWNAIEGAVYNIVREMNCAWPTPTPGQTNRPGQETPIPPPPSEPIADVKKYAESPPPHLPGMPVQAPFCNPNYRVSASAK